MTTDPVSLWMESASRYPLLPKEETLRLSRLVRAWQDEGKNPRAGQRALNRMVVCNMRLVPGVWRKYAGHIRTTDESGLDVLQQGAIGIRTAAVKFDPTRGYEFSTVAYLWIRKEIQDWIRRHERMIRVAADCQSIGGQAPHFIAKFEGTHGRKPTTAEMAQRFNCREATLQFYLERFAMTRASSLNRRIKCDHRGQEDPELIEVIPDGEGVDLVENERQAEIFSVLAVIADRADLEICEVFEAMEWKGAQPPEIKERRRAIRHVGRTLWKRNKPMRNLFVNN